MFDLIAALTCALFGWCGATAQADGCRTLDHLGTTHTVCSFRASDVSVRLFLNDKSGAPYRRLPNLRRSLDTVPLMLMNGGMYHEDLSPVGLYVEDGERRQNLSTKDGWGNFHLLPNGVFWGRDGMVAVTETKAFAATNPNPDFATQSGPMLVIDGKLHPRFIPGSDSVKIRNGIGVSADGARVHFALSHDAISFYDFGTLFRDVFDTPNALFLDGTVSAIDAPGFKRGGFWKELGPMIGVFGRE